MTIVLVVNGILFALFSLMATWWRQSVKMHMRHLVEHRNNLLKFAAMKAEHDANYEEKIAAIMDQGLKAATEATALRGALAQLGYEATLNWVTPESGQISVHVELREKNSPPATRH